MYIMQFLRYSLMLLYYNMFKICYGFKGVKFINTTHKTLQWKLVIHVNWIYQWLNIKTLLCLFIYKSYGNFNIDKSITVALIYIYNITVALQNIEKKANGYNKILEMYFSVIILYYYWNNILFSCVKFINTTNESRPE